MANFFDQFDDSQKTENFFDRFDAPAEEEVKPKVKDAGFSVGDLAKAFGVGATGSTKALTDVAGADNVVSAALGKGVESLQQSMTPERRAEMERQAARMKAAEESGSFLEEVKAGALNVAEAPLQSAAQAIGSFVPYLLSTPVGIGMRLTGASKLAIEAVAKQAPKVIGTAQGAGAVKSSIYDGVLQAEMEAGVDPELAKQKAEAAQSYFGGNIEQILLGAGLGLAAGSKGVEEFFSKAGRAGAPQGIGRRVAESVFKESVPEAAQGGQERLAQNIALQREGYDVDTFAGVAGAATQEALTGALGAAPIAAMVRPEAKTQESVDAFKKEEEEFRKQFGAAEPVEAPAAEAPEVEPPVELPGGYSVARREVSRKEVPEFFNIFAEGSDKPLTTVATQDEVDRKIQTLTEIRKEEQARLLEESDKITKSIQDEQRKLEVMEATGQTDTDLYVQSKALLEQKQDEAAQQLKDINDKIVSYGSPLSFAPVGARLEVENEFVVNRGDEAIGVFPSMQAAETSLRERDPEVFKQADIEAEAQAAAARAQELEATLKPMLAKFNLGDVGLNIVDRLKNNAGGSYLDRLIQVSMEEENPIQTMRHESLHALKDLEFFTPQQWNALKERAEKQWIKEYLEDQTAELEVDGKPVKMSRLDAYKRIGLTQEEIIEEAIADAFGAYDRGETPPPGMIAALFKKLKNFFMNFGQALRGAGFESAEDVFQRIERGELKSRKPAKKAKDELSGEDKYSVKRPAVEDEVEISTQNPSGVKRKYDPLAQMLSIDEKAVLELMDTNPRYRKETIDAIKSYGFIPNGTSDKDAIRIFKENIVNNLLFLYKSVPKDIRNRSKLWYDGANKIATQMADKYGMSLPQVSAIMAAMSPQKDWFQNVSMGERAIDILIERGNMAWTPDMLRYAKSYVMEADKRKEREKREEAFQRIEAVAKKGTVLNDMDEESAAAFIRAYDESFNSRQYRIVTPEGGFGDLVRNKDGTPSTMMWSTYGPIEKAVSIFRDGSRKNISEQLGFEHKIRSFYNNIAAPNSDLEHVTIDTHAVAAALFESLAGTDLEVEQNFGGTGKSDIIGVGGTYGLIADAYREAANKVGILPREMQSITWEAVRGLFSEEFKNAIKKPVKAEWQKYKNGEQTFEQARQNIIEISREKRSDEKDVDIPVPDWMGTDDGQFVEDGGESYDKSYIPEGGVRLRQEKLIRENITFNLSAVTNSIPGLRELYARALKMDEGAIKALQTVAESSLKHLLSGTNARVKIERASGVYMSDREPSLMVSATFSEAESKQVMAALAQFAENFNQQQIHVRMPTNKKLGFEYDDGSYVTPVYEIGLEKSLSAKRISEIIEKTGLQGFTVTQDSLIAYYVKPERQEGESNGEHQQRAKEAFGRFKEAATSAHGLAGRRGEKPKQTNQRLFVYGDGEGAAISYETISGDVYPKQSSDSVTPRVIAEYLTKQPVQTFKPKPLNKAQIKEQKELAKEFDELPVNDLKNPLVKKAYKALTKALKQQFAVIPVKVEIQTEKFRKGDEIPEGFEVGDLKPPYNNNSNAMRKDIIDRNNLLIYPTTPETFGPKGYDFSNHPLLEDSGFEDQTGKPLLWNDVLRAVHDYFAHGLTDAAFGPIGEFTAWRNHMASTPDPLARWALTAETRLQNAWQNFREGAENIPLRDRPFAVQKAALPSAKFLFTGDASVDAPVRDMLAELSEEQQQGSPKKPVKAGKFSLRTNTSPALKEWAGSTTIVDADGNPRAMYHGLAKDTTDFTRKTERGAPIFLTDDPDFAAKFAADSYESVAKNPEKYLTAEQIKDGVKRAIAAIRKDYGKDSFGKEMIESLKDGNLKEAMPEAREYMVKELVSLLPTGPHIMTLYVRAERPFDYENPAHVRQVAKWYKDNIGSEYVPIGRGNMVRASNLPAILKDGQWEAIETDDIQEAIKSLGFDSFYVKEHGRKNLAVYQPNQVKSATGNVGTYSRTSNDVRYSLKNVAFPSAEEARKAVAATSVPKTEEFKRFIAGNQWVDEDGEQKAFYHGTASEFFEFTPAGKASAIYLADTPEEAEAFGKIAEDRLRQQIYRALTKDEKVDFFQRIVDAKVESGSMTEKDGADFMRQVKRKAPEFDKFGDLQRETRAALIDLSPTRTAIMPLYARAETPFDFRNPEHVAQVVKAVKRPDAKLSEEAKQEAREMGVPTEYPDHWYRGLPGRLKQGFTTSMEDEPVQTAIRRLGFDGYVSRRNRTSPLVYAVYKPEQVKSVTGNIGEFDRESKDVRYSLPNIPKNITDRINESTFKRQEKGFIERMIEAISPQRAASFRQRYLNRYNQMSVYDKALAEKMGGAALLADQSAESAALMSDLGAGIAASAMGMGDRNGGIPILRNGITTIDTKVKGLIASLAPLAAYGDPVVYQRYQYWAMVKRGQRLNKEGKLTGIDSADVAFAKFLEQKHPEFVSVQKDLITFNNGLVQYMVDTGVLSKERGHEYTKYADYIPFYRQMDDGETTLGPNLFQSLSGVKPPKKLKGKDVADAPLADFLETMVRNTQSAIQAGIKNYAAQRAINVALQVKAPGMDLQRLNTASTAPNVINVLEKGKLVSYQTPDTLLVDAMKSLNLSELPFMGVLSAPADFLRNLVTKDPGFMMANLMRDSLSAWVTSGQKMTPIAGTVINFGKALTRNSPGFEAMQNAGIIGGYEFSANIEKSGFQLEEDLKRKAGKRTDSILLRPFKSVWDALEVGTTASDAATRALIYERVLKDTGNEAEALYRSLEVMNFHRKGNSALVRVLTATVPFFNARLQGLDLFYRASTGNMNNKDAAAIQRQFWARGMTMAALSTVYWMMVSDDEEYKKQEQETKDNNWIIPSIGAKIPIPFEVGVLFKVIPERIVAYTFGDDTGQDLKDSAMRGLVSTFAFNPTPQIVKPIAEAVVDFNPFTWRPILGKGLQEVEAKYQVGPSTSQFATVIAQNLGLSPMKVDHVLKGYSGTIGMYGIDTIDMILEQFGDSPKATKRFEQLPIIKRFAADPDARGNVTQYYQLKDAVDTTVRTMNLLEKTGESEEYVKYLKANVGTLAFKDYINDTEKTMKELRDMRNAVRSSQMSGDEKRDALLEISKAESAITSQIQLIKKSIASIQ